MASTKGNHVSHFLKCRKIKKIKAEYPKLSSYFYCNRCDMLYNMSMIKLWNE